MMHRIENGQVIPLTAEEIAELEAREAAWEAGANDRAAEEVRKERDRLLAETDWVVIRSVENSGKPVSAAMKAYRQALRDLDQQAGWPANITWPVKPE